MSVYGVVDTTPVWAGEIKYQVPISRLPRFGDNSKSTDLNERVIGDWTNDPAGL